jgi:hypothetical protein
LNVVYEIGYKQALENIKRNGGTINEKEVSIVTQSPATVKFEKSFSDLYPLEKTPVKWSADNSEISFEFAGTGFVLMGETTTSNKNYDYVFRTELYIDDKLTETPKLPVSFIYRRNDLAWKYGMQNGKHKVKLKILNLSADCKVNAHDALIYTDHPVNGMQLNLDAATKQN